MKQSISTDLTAANISRVIAYLSATPDELARLSAGLPDDRRRQPLGPGERSFQEVLAHLIHTEARSSEAIYLALLLRDPLLHDVHAERQWGKLLRFAQQPFADLLAYIALRRKVLLTVLEGLPESAWSRAMRQEGKQRHESVYWQARGLALHEAEHLADLSAKLPQDQHPGPPA